MICGRSGFRTGREAIRFEHMLQLPPSRNDDGVESQARAPLGVPVACARRNGGGLVRRRFVAAWLGLLAALFVLRVVYITQAGPYVRHVDEEFLSRAAGKIVDSGDLAPRFYMYPSLPVYLSALGFAIGSVFDSALDEARPALVKVSYSPTYRPPNRGFAARFLFCLLGTLAVALGHCRADQLAGLVAAALRDLHLGHRGAAGLVKGDQFFRLRGKSPPRKASVESVPIFPDKANVVHGARLCPLGLPMERGSRNAEGRW